MLHKRLPGGVKIVESIAFDRRWVGLSTSLKTEEFKPVVQSYALSMDRVTAMPACLVNLASWVRGSFDKDPIVNELLWKTKGEEHTLAVFGIGGSLVNSFLDSTPSVLENDSVTLLGAQGILYAMVLSSFVAFEALAGDLWVEAVNLYPDSFKGKDKSVPISFLKDYGHDVRATLGDMLRDAGKVSFDTLRGIRDAYDNLVASDVYAENPDLRMACKVRNLIAHRAGVVDSIFVKEMDKTVLADYKVGDVLTFNGPETAALINPCVECTVRIVERLDNWAARYAARSQ